MSAVPSSARERILARLRASQAVRPLHVNPSTETEREWLARQPPIGEVRRAAGWAALPALLPAWLAEAGVQRVITGTEPRLEPLRAALAADGRFALGRYDRPVEAQRGELFAADCGITTCRGAIAETGSLILVPTPEEPRLLSLAPALHLAIVERAALHATLADFIAGGSYQAELPSNLVLVSGASRTADIELVLAIGVHGPKRLLVALVE